MFSESTELDLKNQKTPFSNRINASLQTDEPESDFLMDLMEYGQEEEDDDNIFINQFLRDQLNQVSHNEANNL